jgi:integrase
MIKIIPLTKEEMNSLMKTISEAAKNYEKTGLSARKNKNALFDLMLFSVLRYTGRNIGELYGIEEKKIIGREIIGTKKATIKGKDILVDKAVFTYKKTGKIIGGVQLKDVDLKKKVINIPFIEKGEVIEGLDNSVYLPEEVIEMIKEYVKKNNIQLNDFLFRKKNRGYRQIENILSSYSILAGIKHKVTTHNFRDYLIKEMIAAGYRDGEIKRLIGLNKQSLLKSYII